MTTDLAAALRTDARNDAMRTFAKVIFAARDYTQAKERGKITAKASEALDRAAMAFCQAEASWTPLVRRQDDWLTPPWSIHADEEEVRLWRLRHHVRRYIPGLYPAAFGKVGVDYDEWLRISAIRGKAFRAAVAEMTWEGLAP